MTATLSAQDLATLAASAFGSEWQSALSRGRGVALRTVQRWARDGIAKPDTAAAIRAYLLSRRVVDLPAPPGDDPDRRDDAAHQVMGELLDVVVEAGVAVGWHEAELLAGALAGAVDRMAAGAGAPATRELLRGVVDQLARRAGERA